MGHAAKGSVPCSGPPVLGRASRTLPRGRGRVGLDGQLCSLRGIAASHEPGPWVVGFRHKWEAELFGPIPSHLGRLLMTQGSDREQAPVGLQAWHGDRGAVQGVTGMTWCCWIQVRPFDATHVQQGRATGMENLQWKLLADLVEMEPALGRDSAAEQELQHVWHRCCGGTPGPCPGARGTRGDVSLPALPPPEGREERVNPLPQDLSSCRR